MSAKSRYFRRRDTGYKEVNVPEVSANKGKKRSLANKKECTKNSPEKRQMLNNNKCTSESLSVSLETKLLAFSTRNIPSDSKTWIPPSTINYSKDNQPTIHAYQQTEQLTNDKVKRKLTPLEEQIIALKKKHPAILLMVACGYRYRFFGDEDANIASKVLDIRYG